MTPDRFAPRSQAALASAAPALLLVALIIYLGAEEGGFFPETTAAATVALAAALILRTALAKEPFAGFGLALAFAALPAGLFAVWTLTSGLWSDAPGRALVEFNRALLYVLALLFFGSYARSLSGARGLVRAFALAATALCTAAFLSRALPDVFEVSPGFLASRLGFPLTYWNALGLLAALGLILCLSLTSDERESSPVRVLAAAARSAGNRDGWPGSRARPRKRQVGRERKRRRCRARSPQARARGPSPGPGSATWYMTRRRAARARTGVHD